MQALGLAGVDSGWELRLTSARHHNPAGWLTYDGFRCAAPDDFVEPGMAISPHHQEINAMGTHISVKDLANRATTDSNGFKRGFDPMLRKMIGQRGAGPHLL